MGVSRSARSFWTAAFEHSIRADHNESVPLIKLHDGNSFVVTDFADADASGPVRVAPKVLQSTSKELARSLTYRLALGGIPKGGLAAGINTGEDRAAALQGFLDEATARVAEGAWKFFPLMGLDSSDTFWTSAVDEAAEAAGIVAAVETAVAANQTPTVAIDGLGAMSKSLAEALTTSGMRVVAAAAKSGTVTGEALDATALTELGARPDADQLASVGVLSEQPASTIECDVLLAGGGMGSISHTNADSIHASVVVPITLLPLTTKAAVMLHRRGVVALPDFLTLAGGSLVAEGAADSPAAAADFVRSVTGDVLAEAEEIPSVTAAKRSEAFLATWHEPVFGRPFAP